MSEPKGSDDLIKRLEDFAHSLDAKGRQDGENNKETKLFDNSYHEQRLAELHREEKEDYLGARKFWRKGGRFAFGVYSSCPRGSLLYAVLSRSRR